MNLLFCSARFHPDIGGAESMLDDLTRTLAARGESVSVLTRRSSPDQTPEEVRHGVQIVRETFPETAVRSATGLVGAVSSLCRLWWTMGAMLRARRIDVACVGLVGVDLLPLLLWRWVRSFRLVIYLHGGELRSYVRVSPLMRWTLRRAFRTCDVVIAVSESLRQEAIRFEPRVRRRVVVIPNAVAAAALHSTPPYQHARPFALFAGRLHPVKDLDTLIAAFERVAREVTDLDLIIAGEGPLGDHVRDQVRKRGLSDRVRFAGAQSREGVAALIRGCAFGVLPSLAEGSPMFVLEAQAAGRLVIGSRVKGIVEVIDDHLTGELFGAGSVSELAERMICASDPSNRRAIESVLVERPPADIEAAWRQHVSAYRGEAQPLSIAVISSFFGHDPSNSGLSSYYLTLCRSLMATGHEVHLITTPESARHALASGVNTTATRTSQTELLAQSPQGRVAEGLGRVAARVRFAWESWRHVAALDRTGRIDVVVAPELFAPGLFVALFMRRKLVTRVHTPTVVGDHHNLPGRASWVSRVVAWPERVQAVRSRGCSAASHSLIQAVSREWRIPESRIARVPNAISIEAASALAEQQPREIGGEYVLYIGRLEQRKGVHVLTNALADVLDRHPTLTAVYAGGDWGLKASILESKAYATGRLMVLGTMERPRLFGLIRHARLVVLPSLFENISNAALESMALGRPVVGTRRTAFAELIDHEVTGFLVDPGDWEGLSRTLDRALGRSDLETIGARGREHVRQFDALTIAQAQVAFMRDAVSR